MAWWLERLAGLIAPVLCHMAEEHLQEPPLPRARDLGVRTRLAPIGAEWNAHAAEQATNQHLRDCAAR